MAELVRSIDVDLPAERLWAVVTDWAGQGRWMLATRVRPTSGAGRAPGDELLAVTGRTPLALYDRMVIIDWSPPHRCVVRHTGRMLRGSAAFEVLALSPTRARFVWAEWLRLPFGRFGAVGWLLVRPLAGLGLAVSLRRLARLAPGWS